MQGSLFHMQHPNGLVWWRSYAEIRLIRFEILVHLQGGLNPVRSLNSPFKTIASPEKVEKISIYFLVGPQQHLERIVLWQLLARPLELPTKTVSWQQLHSRPWPQDITYHLHVMRAMQWFLSGPLWPRGDLFIWQLPIRPPWLQRRKVLWWTNWKIHSLIIWDSLFQSQSHP